MLVCRREVVDLGYMSSEMFGYCAEGEVKLLFFV